MTKIFPTILIILMFAASAAYFYDAVYGEGNWRMGVYWFAAGVLNIAVTF